LKGGGSTERVIKKKKRVCLRRQKRKGIRRAYFLEKLVVNPETKRREGSPWFRKKCK
jgi:hypothetical protein